MPDLQAAIHDIAVKAFDGQYGDNPFGVDTEGYERLFADAWNLIGQYDPENWYGDDNTNVIMDSIRDDYDLMARAEAIENMPESIRSAWEIEAMEEEAAKHPLTPMSVDDIILQSNNPARDMTILDKQNEYKVANGDKPVCLDNSTIDALAGQGIDASRFKDPSSPPLEVPVAVPVEYQPVESVEQEQLERFDTNEGQEQVDRSEETQAVDSTVVEDSPNTDSVSNVDAEQYNADMPDNMRIVLDNEGNPIDIAFSDPEQESNEITLSDVLKDMAEQDPEFFTNVFHNAIEMAENGEDYKAYLSDAIDKYATEHTEIPNDIEKEKEPEIGSEKVTVDENTVKDEIYQKRFDEYTEKIKDARDKYVPLRGDTIDAFNQMARVYNAYKGDIEINGRVPNVVDVAVSAMNFIRTNPLETLVIHALRFAVDELRAKDVEKEEKPEGVEKEQSVVTEAPVDKEGFRENGTIDRTPTSDMVSSVDMARKGNPLAGKSFGADMSQVDRGSTDSVKVRTTNPDAIQGRGIQVTLDNADKFVFPDIRLVELKGTNMLVSPFGKVVEVLDAAEKYQVGQQLGGQLDASGSKRGSEALDTFAKEHGITREEAKNAITAECKERFCARIESSYRVEAKAIENHVIPRELETKAELNSAIATIERLEGIPGSPIDKETLSKTKEELISARTTIEGKIADLGTRVKELEKSDKNGVARSLNERFADAVSSEKKAIGRSVFTVDVGVDRKSVDEMKQKGVEFIRDKVSAYNADKPEMDRVSYDSKTGVLVDRYGITEKGEYVGNKYGPYMAEGVSGPDAMTREDTEKYVNEHFDISRFDTEKIFPDDTKNDVENEGTETKVEAMAEDKNVDVAVIEAEQPDTEQAENKDLEAEQRDNDDTKQSQHEVETNAENAVENEKDPTKDEKDPTDTDHDKVDDERKEEDHADQDEKSDVEQERPEDGDAADTTTADDKDQLESIANDDAQEGSISNELTDDVENATNDVQQPDTADVEDAANDASSADTDTDEVSEITTDEELESHDVTPEIDDDDIEAVAEDDEEKETDVAAIEETELSNENVFIESDDMAADIDNEETSGDAVDIYSGDGDGETDTKVSVQNAIEGEDDTAHDDDDEKDRIDSDGASDKKDDDNSSLLDDIGDWVDNFFDDFDLNISSPLDLIESSIDGKLAEIEELKDFLCEIKDAETLGDAIELVADRMADSILNSIEAEIDHWESIFDLVQDVFEAIVDAFGPENGVDLVNDMMYDFASADISEAVRSEAFNVVEDILPTHTDAPDSIEVDGMEITSDGLFDAFTGDEIGFDTDAQMDAFGTDIESEIQNSIESTFDNNMEIAQDQIELTQPDIADIDTPLDYGQIDTGIDADADLGIDNKVEGNVDMPSPEDVEEAAEAADALETLIGALL